MINLHPQDAKVGAYYTDCRSKMYYYVLKVDSQASAPNFTYSCRSWLEEDWSYPRVQNTRLEDIDEVRGCNILGPRHPADGGTASAQHKCECGADKIKAPRHSTWCPKYEP